MKLRIIILLNVVFFNATAQIWQPFKNRFYNPAINDVIEFNSQIVIGGSFLADSLYLNNIARWDGSDWQPFAQGMMGGINTMTIFNNQLYAGGGYLTIPNLTNPGKIVRWDGVAWNKLNNGVTSGAEIYTMCEFGGSLYIGGRFTEVDGIPANNLARWDGTSWYSVANISGTFPRVSAMVVYNNELYVGGYFEFVNGISMVNIAKYNGTIWSDVDMGVNSNVIAMVVDSVNNRLYAAGNFTGCIGSGMLFPTNVAYWDGMTWHGVGTNPSINPRALCFYKNSLYAGFSFEAIKANNDTLKYIAKWDGNEWQSVNKGVNDNVIELKVLNGMFIVAGSFTQAGDSSVNYVAAYTDTTTSVHELNTVKQEITITPNPTKNSISVTSPVAVSADSITSPTGQIIKKQNQKPLKEFSVDTSTLPNGLYIFTASMGKQLVSIKFAKE